MSAYYPWREESPESLCKLFCPVCGDKTSGFHYGIPTCESCKGFFKRTVQKSRNYLCSFQKMCKISIKTRRKCAYCRFQKCLSRGMKTALIRQNRKRGGRNNLSGYYREENLKMNKELGIQKQIKEPLPQEILKDIMGQFKELVDFELDYIKKHCLYPLTIHKSYVIYILPVITLFDLTFQYCAEGPNSIISKVYRKFCKIGVVMNCFPPPVYEVISQRLSFYPPKIGHVFAGHLKSDILHFGFFGFDQIYLHNTSKCFAADYYVFVVRFVEELLLCSEMVRTLIFYTVPGFFTVDFGQ